MWTSCPERHCRQHCVCLQLFVKSSEDGCGESRIKLSPQNIDAIYSRIIYVGMVGH